MPGGGEAENDPPDLMKVEVRKGCLPSGIEPFRMSALGQ